MMNSTDVRLAHQVACAIRFANHRHLFDYCRGSHPRFDMARRDGHQIGHPALPLPGSSRRFRRPPTRSTPAPPRTDHPPPEERFPGPTCSDGRTSNGAGPHFPSLPGWYFDVQPSRHPSSLEGQLTRISNSRVAFRQMHPGRHRRPGPDTSEARKDSLVYTGSA